MGLFDLLPVAQRSQGLGAKPKGPGFLRTLDGVLGGQTITGVRDDYADRQAQQAALEERQAQLRGAMQGRSQDEVLAALLNPAEFAKSLSSNFEASNIAAGSTRRLGNGATYTAPEMGVDGGFGYRQDDKGIQWQGQRPMSYDETRQQTDMVADNERADEGLDIERDKLALDSLIRKGLLSVEQGQLALAKIKQKADASKGSAVAAPPPGFVLE